MKLALAAVVAVLMIAGPAVAETRTSSNGVVVSIDGDEFKPRIDYATPWEKAGEEGHLFAVRKMNDGRIVYMVQGIVSYSGEWRMYDRAYLTGGRSVQFDSLGRNVGSCSRYGGCSLTEEFQLTFTPEQMTEAVAKGDLRVQISGGSGGDLVVSVNPEYVRAAIEISGANPTHRTAPPVAVSPAPQAPAAKGASTQHRKAAKGKT